MPSRRLSQPEFIALLALLFSVIAFSTDAMLPSLPQIAGEFSPDDPNRAQLIVAAFVFGLGIGTFLTGPISDAFGRKGTIIGGLAVYAGAAILASQAQSLEMLLAARALQGLGGAAPRIAGLAMVRDLYEGRKMAQISSFVMMIFILVPAVAPSLGALIAGFGGWRAVFGAFVVFAFIAFAWLGARQGETLPREARKPLRAGVLWGGFRQVLAHRMVMIVTVILAFGFGQMLGLISTVQQVYGETFGIIDRFPLWFAATALFSGLSTIFNARFVVRLGMRRISRAAYGMQTVISAAILAALWAGVVPAGALFWVFFVWSCSVFTMAGLTFGNLNALALQPMGHIAGMAASVVGGLSTVLAVGIAIPMGQAFDGTITPLVLTTFICSALAFLLMRLVRENP